MLTLLIFVLIIPLIIFIISIFYYLRYFNTNLYHINTGLSIFLYLNILIFCLFGFPMDNLFNLNCFKEIFDFSLPKMQSIFFNVLGDPFSTPNGDNCYPYREGITYPNYP